MIYEQADWKDETGLQEASTRPNQLYICHSIKYIDALIAVLDLRQFNLLKLI